MKSQDLKLDELIDFSEGLVSLHGRRLILHDIHAFAQFRKDLLDMVGDGTCETRLHPVWVLLGAGGCRGNEAHLPVGFAG